MFDNVLVKNWSDNTKFHALFSPKKLKKVREFNNEQFKNFYIQK